MKKYYDLIKKNFDLPSYQNTALRIYNLESSFCYRNFADSAKLCYRELRKAGAKETEFITLNADGKTGYFDYTIPEAWDVDEARLEIVEPENTFIKVLADRKENSFCVANRCASTPGEGITAEVVTADYLRKNSDLSGKMVFIDDTHPAGIRDEVVNKNAAGIISAFSPGKELLDHTYWINGLNFRGGWYHTKKDKKILCFSLSPGKGNYLRSLLSNSGQVKVLGKVKSRTYPGQIFNVTGLLPGQTKEEVLFLSHIYEPMLNDNATGAAALIEMCRILSRLIKEGKIPPLKRGIRFLIGMERYGMAQFFAGKKRNTLTALIVDGISYDIAKTGRMHLGLYLSPVSRPFFGDSVLEHLLESYFPRELPWKAERGGFIGDTSISNCNLGIPTAFLYSDPGRLHHNSFDLEALNWNTAKEITILLATYAYLLAADDEQSRKSLESVSYLKTKEELFSFYRCLKKRFADTGGAESKVDVEEQAAFFCEYLTRKLDTLRTYGFTSATKNIAEIEKLNKKELKTTLSSLSFANGKNTLSAEDKRADKVVITETVKISPFSMGRVPGKEKIERPGEIDTVLNWVNGKRSLHQIYRMVDCERALYGQAKLNREEKQSLTDYVLFLDKYQYLTIKHKA